MTIVASAFRAERDWGSARAAVEVAVAADPIQSSSLRELAWLCLQTNSLGEARVAAERACQLASGGHDEMFARALDVMGVCERRLNDPIAAVEAGRRAVELVPGCAEFHSHLSSSFAAAGDEAAAERHRRLASDLSSSRST